MSRKTTSRLLSNPACSEKGHDEEKQTVMETGRLKEANWRNRARWVDPSDELFTPCVTAEASDCERWGNRDGLCFPQRAAGTCWSEWENHTQTHTFPILVLACTTSSAVLCSVFFFFKAEAVKMNLNFHHMRPHWWKQNADTSKDYSPHFGGKIKLVGFLSESETRRSVCLTRVCAVNMKLKPRLVIFTFCFLDTDKVNEMQLELKQNQASCFPPVFSHYAKLS